MVTTQTEENKCSKEPARLTNIKVSKELADAVKVYCIFNNKTVTDFTTQVLERELKGFRERLAQMRSLR